MGKLIYKNNEYVLFHCKANKRKGYNFDFLFLSPKRIGENVKIFVEGANSAYYNNNGHYQSYAEQVDFEIQQAIGKCQPQSGKVFNMPYLYQILHQPVIIPIFERCDEKHKNEFYAQMLGKNVMHETDGKYSQLNKQVLAMIDEVKRNFEKKDVNVSSTCGLIGVSTSAVFANRLQFIEPETFDMTISVCGNAVQPLPLKSKNGVELTYPLGTADYKELFGKEFNSEAYKNAKILNIVGANEDNNRYNIVNNSLLHDKETKELYHKVYGDVSLQERQLEIENIYKENDYDNCYNLVGKGAHELNSKGMVIAKFIREYNTHTNNNINVNEPTM